MTKFDTIMQELATDPLYMDICSRYTSNEYLKEELYQEFFIVILEYNKDKIIEIYNKNQLKYFCIGIIRTMATSDRSPFFRKIRKPELETNEITGPIERVDVSNEILEKELFDKTRLTQIEDILKRHQQKHPREYGKIKLFKMYYYDDMTYREISSVTKIPLTSIFDAVKEIKELLNKRIIKQ